MQEYYSIENMKKAEAGEDDGLDKVSSYALDEEGQEQREGHWMGTLVPGVSTTSLLSQAEINANENVVQKIDELEKIKEQTSNIL